MIYDQSRTLGRRAGTDGAASVLSRDHGHVAALRHLVLQLNLASVRTGPAPRIEPVGNQCLPRELRFGLPLLAGYAPLSPSDIASAHARRVAPARPQGLQRPTRPFALAELLCVPIAEPVPAHRLRAASERTLFSCHTWTKPAAEKLAVSQTAPLPAAGTEIFFPERISDGSVAPVVRVAQAQGDVGIGAENACRLSHRAAPTTAACTRWLGGRFRDPRGTGQSQRYRFRTEARVHTCRRSCSWSGSTSGDGRRPVAYWRPEAPCRLRRRRPGSREDPDKRSQAGCGLWSPSPERGSRGTWS